jgi:cephalosporin-C deacetylase
MLMRMRLAIVGAFCLLLALVCGIGAQTKDGKKDPKDAKGAKEVKPTPILLRAECERPDALYKVGESVAFFLVSNTSGEIEYKFTDDGMKVVREDKFRANAGQTYKLQGKLDHPGFLRLQLTQGTATAAAAAGVEPTKIAPTAKAPADFEEFWQEQRKELEKVRLDQVVEIWVQESTPTVNVYRVNLASIEGRRVYGWVAAPKGPGPFPAILSLPGAGVSGIKPDLYHANLGAVAMNIIIHDFPVDYPADFYKKQAETTLKNYTRIGWDDRSQNYFRYAILAGVRAVDYLSGRKDVDPKQIAVTGSSQGGGLTLCVSGLDDRVLLAAPNVAGLCDLNARSQGRIDGWPHWGAAAPEKIKEKVEATGQYFDAVHFARKFKGKSLHGVGFVDTVCPPSTVYAAFNQLPDPKIMIDSPKMGHDTDERWKKAREDFWKENLKLKPPPMPTKK